MILLAAFLALLALAAAYDVMMMRIPNLLCGAIAALFAVPASLVPGVPVLWHLAAAGAVLVVGGGLFAFRMMGGGDVKLLAACALWLGMDNMVPMLVAMALSGLVVLLVLMPAQRIARRLQERSEAPAWVPKSLLAKGVPYGVAIAAAAAFVAVRMPSPVWAF